MSTEDLTIHKRVIPARKAQYASYPDQMSEELKDYLRQKGISSLYCHQVEMFEKAIEGSNLVITTSTASGKTLSFLLPILQKILEDPLSRAIFIYPTKALAADQYRALLPILNYFGKSRVNAGVYDGDTPTSERSRIRKNCNIILTNPEMLNGAFLPNHSRFGFDFIFSNLKYVVVDELHTCRGVFGSHVANLMRRLNRICHYYGADPQFLCSSATISNPRWLAEEIFAKPFIEISKDGSPSGVREYYLIQPPRIEDEVSNFQGQIPASTIVARMLPEFIEERKSFIAFAGSRRKVEVILREARDKLDQTALLGKTLSDKISGYRGGYTPLERKEIERKMTSGELTGLVSTNALELGIDIGKIDTTILCGFPGTRASFWQQTGRAGRQGRLCQNFMVLESQPFDQYIGIEPDWLFNSDNENAIIDKDNLLIELAHIRAAAAELPLSLSDISVFPDLGEALPVLMRLGEVKKQGGHFAWCGNAFPAGDFSMRNMDKIRYKLIDQESHVEVTEMDELQAFHELHDGAIYLHEGRQYQVIRLDRQTHTAFAIPFHGNYYTMPGTTTEVSILHEQESKPFGLTKVSFGDVNVNDVVFMYKKLQFHNHQNLGYEMLPLPLSKEYNTESCWIRIPEVVVNNYRRLLKKGPDGSYVRNNHFDGMCHAIKYAARLVTMTESEDLGVTMSDNVLNMPDSLKGEVHLYLYDKFVGGLGYAQKAYEELPAILEKATRLVSECRCKDGCAACVGDHNLDKRIVRWGLESLLAECELPSGIRQTIYAKRPVEKKAFHFEELAEKWPEFVSFLNKTGENLAAFLMTIPEVEISGHTLSFEVESEFYQSWILENSNVRSLMNVIHFYTDAPSDLRINVDLKDASYGAKEKLIKEKLQKRYQYFKEETDGNHT